MNEVQNIMETVAVAQTCNRLQPILEELTPDKRYKLLGNALYVQGLYDLAEFFRACSKNKRLCTIAGKKKMSAKDRAYVESLAEVHDD